MQSHLLCCYSNCVLHQTLTSSGLLDYRILCNLHSTLNVNFLEDSAQIVCDVTLCCWVSVFRRFERTQCLHLQGLSTNGKTRREKPEDLNSQQYRCENLEARILWRSSWFFNITIGPFSLFLSFFLSFFPSLCVF